MLRSNYHVDKHTGDIIEKTSFNGNHARDIKMNTIVVILAAVVLGAAVDVQKPKTIESGNVEYNGGEDDKATVKAPGQNESTLLYIRSLIAKINGINQAKNADRDEKNNRNEDSESSNADFGKESDESDIGKNVTNESEIGRNGEDNRRINILESIKNILKGDALYRRLDIEDSNDVSAEVDIDDPIINEFNRDAFSGLKLNRGYTGYGASLEMKGRSGGVHEDQPIYYPAIPRRLFYNPGYGGYYPRATPAPVAIPINRDSLIQRQPLNLFKSLPQRRTESQVNEETIIDILDDANSYKYTPEDVVEAPMSPWSHGNFPIV